MTNNAKISRDDLPSLYHTATLGSQNAQKSLLLLTKLNLLLLVFGAFFSSVNLDIIPAADATLKTGINNAGTLVLIVSIFLPIAVEVLGLQRKWYDGRAMAESIKTLSWKFMMNAEPYRSQRDPVGKFCDDLSSVLKDKKSFGDLLGGAVASRDEVTNRMLEVRKMKFQDKWDIYLNNRIRGQRSWYSEKSAQNNDQANFFFVVLVITQLAAIFSSIWLGNNENYLINPTGVITTISASLIAWTQLKQHRVLAESYGLTTHELGIIESKFKKIKKDSELAEFVLESEDAISREHTVWLARKVNIS